MEEKLSELFDKAFLFLYEAAIEELGFSFPSDSKPTVVKTEQHEKKNT